MVSCKAKGGWRGGWKLGQQGKRRKKREGMKRKKRHILGCYTNKNIIAKWPNDNKYLIKITTGTGADEQAMGQVWRKDKRESRNRVLKRSHNELKKSRNKEVDETEGNATEEQGGGSPCPHLPTTALAQSSFMAGTQVGAASFCSTENIRDPIDQVQAAGTCAEPHCADRTGNRIIYHTFLPHHHTPTPLLPPNPECICSWLHLLVA